MYIMTEGVKTFRKIVSNVRSGYYLCMKMGTKV